MIENEIKYNSYENTFYINDDDGISQIISPELIVATINDYKNELAKLKQQSRIRRDDALETLNDLERAYENNKKALNRIQQLEEENRKLKYSLNNTEKELREYKGKHIVDYNGLNCEYHWLKTEKEELEKENKKLKEEVKSLKKKNEDYFNNINNLILDNMIFKNEILALNKRDNLIRDHLYNNKAITLDKYNEIVNRIYAELRNKTSKQED